MNRRRAWVVVLLLLVGGLTWKLTSPWGEMQISFTPAKKSCYDGQAEGTRWRYCVHESVQGTNGDLAYVFHGRGQDENTWNDGNYYTSMIQKEWERQGVKPPKVVTVSFGPIWFLVPKGTSERSGLLATFRERVMPEIEARLGNPRRRLLMGESMGGLNALLIGLQSPGLFTRVIALCPVLYRDPLLSGWGVIAHLLRRRGADPRTVMGGIALAKAYVGSEGDEWKSLSPLELLERADVAHAPEFYVSCGLRDRYGNFEGAELFAERAKAKGIKLKWRPLFGGHCAIDAVSAAEGLL